MKYRVWMEQINQTFVDVEAKSRDEAAAKGFRKWKREYAVAAVLAVEPLKPKP